AYRNSKFQHSPHRRRAFGSLLSVALHEVLALIRHAMLNRDAAAERLYPFQIAVRNRFTMIEEPIQSLERSFPIHFFKHADKSCGAFVVGRMQTERRLVGGAQRDHFFQFALQRGGQIRTRLKEVLKVRCREDEHLPRAIAAEENVAVAWPGHSD